ncbi:S-adenosylmethionine decarboxylase family protein [Crocinitomix catalasitica]|uniref:S-adenosylmethionine decarboxylase family protein n=1 Tax=Crocinitomix catalasitica TaxID=184607 RepID=UPI000686916E|nr:S-adenosylmethionine decarboxylase [Crocinitomix catalasitica]
MKAELYSLRCWVKESDAELLKNGLGSLLDRCTFEKLGFVEHYFQPQGYTCLWLLGESHLAVHTYPEHNKAYIELTSCVKEKNDLFMELISQIFASITGIKIDKSE